MGNRRLVGVDVGGTFTDVVAIDDGAIVATKVPTDPAATDASVLAGAAEIDVDQARSFNLASTAGLNAVLTRRMPKVALLTTFGHRDTLDRGHERRPWGDLMNLSWRRNFGDAGGRPLVPRYLRRGVKERILAGGDVLVPLDEEQARLQLRVLARCQVEGVAICLINAYVSGAHERALAALVAEELPGVPYSLSSVVSPLAKEFPRMTTTVTDVLMKLLYDEYTDQLEAGLKELGFDGQLNYADCRALLQPSDYAMERPHDLIVGGPAAGTMAAAHFGGAIGDGELICADVGGTSCDISLVRDGVPLYKTEFELEHDLAISAPSTDIVTLGAGGGSIVSVTSTGDIATGPDSAGAAPGPACYGQGGERPTLTDAALLIGVLNPSKFLGGRKALDPERARLAFASLDTQLDLGQRVRSGWGMGLNAVAEGLMRMTIRQGLDIRDLSLMAFGAAGPMWLPALLDSLPLRRVIVPPHPGQFSALGLVSSDQVYSDVRSRYMVLSPPRVVDLAEIFGPMEERLWEKVPAEDRDAAVLRRSFDARLTGQGWDTPFVAMPPGVIDENTVAKMSANFHAQYERLNGIRFESLEVQCVTYRVEIIVPAEKATFTEVGASPGDPPATPIAFEHLYGDAVDGLEYERGSLGLGAEIEGPAVIREEMSTTFVPMNHRGVVGEHGEIIIT